MNAKQYGRDVSFDNVYQKLCAIEANASSDPNIMYPHRVARVKDKIYPYLTLNMNPAAKTKNQFLSGCDGDGVDLLSKRRREALFLRNNECSENARDFIYGLVTAWLTTQEYDSILTTVYDPRPVLAKVLDSDKISKDECNDCPFPQLAKVQAKNGCSVNIILVK